MTIKKGNTIKVEYTGKLEDGKIFDSSKHGDHSHPLEFKVGEGKVIPGFEKAVIGMKKGEEKTVSIKSEDAYGPKNPKLHRKVPKEQFPDNEKVKQGSVVMVAFPTGQQVPVTVVKVEEDGVILDLNHPLAGKDLTFDIKIVDIQ